MSGPSTRVSLGLQLVPTMSAAVVVATIRVAEELGYDHCMVADEGLMQDVWVCLGAAARETSTIGLGVVTNGYTRHPAATAAAAATLNELSGGRAIVELVAGGTMVLDPMGIERSAPAAVVDDTIEVLRRLWSGEEVTWEGRHHRLSTAVLAHGRQDIPIWVAARGERILAIAGAKADAVVLMAKSDLEDAIGVVEASGGSPDLVYLDRLAFTPEMIEEARGHYAYAILDSPVRMLGNLGIDDQTMRQLRDTFARGGAEAIAPLVTDEMVAAYQIAGSPDLCRRQLQDLIVKHRLNGFLINIISPGIEENRKLMADVAAIVGEVET